LRYVDPDGRQEIVASHSIAWQLSQASPAQRAFLEQKMVMEGIGASVPMAAAAGALAWQLAPALWMETQFAAGSCLASPGCQNAVRGGIEGAVPGAPPGSMGSIPEADWAQLSGIRRAASRGKGNFGVGAATAEQAEALGKAWVGEGATAASDGVTLLSADKLRQYRPPGFTAPTYPTWRRSTPSTHGSLGSFSR
jgi:hypothetical protein